MQDKDTQKPAPRIPLKVGVEYRRSYARNNQSGTLKNISMTGAFLVAPIEELAPRDKITINFAVSGRKREITAEVIWCNNIGCGVRFMPSNNRDVQIVDDLMYFVENKREARREVLDGIFKKVA